MKCSQGPLLRRPRSIGDQVNEEKQWIHPLFEGRQIAGLYGWELPWNSDVQQREDDPVPEFLRCESGGGVGGGQVRHQFEDARHPVRLLAQFLGWIEALKDGDDPSIQQGASVGRKSPARPRKAVSDLGDQLTDRRIPGGFRFGRLDCEELNEAWIENALVVIGAELGGRARSGGRKSRLSQGTSNSVCKGAQPRQVRAREGLGN